MSTHRVGVLLFTLLLVAVALLAVASLLAYIGHASKSGGMQSVAGGFGLLVVLIPTAVIVAIPLCLLVIFLAFRSRR